MGETKINGQRYAFADIKLEVNGHALEGVRSIDYEPRAKIDGPVQAFGEISGTMEMKIEDWDALVGAFLTMPTVPRYWLRRNEHYRARWNKRLRRWFGPRARLSRVTFSINDQPINPAYTVPLEVVTLPLPRVGDKAKVRP